MLQVEHSAILWTFIKLPFVIKSFVSSIFEWPLKTSHATAQLSLNAGQKYCRMLQAEHSAILSTFIKLPFVIKSFVSSIFEWPLKTSHATAQLSLNAGQKYCRMLQAEHSAILWTFIKLPFVIKSFVSSIFEWPLKTSHATAQLSLNAGQKYCRMLQGEHSAILSTFIKLPFVIKS